MLDSAVEDVLGVRVSDAWLLRMRHRHTDYRDKADPYAGNNRSAWSTQQHRGQGARSQVCALSWWVFSPRQRRICKWWIWLVELYSFFRSIVFLTIPWSAYEHDDLRRVAANVTFEHIRAAEPSHPVLEELYSLGNHEWKVLSPTSAMLHHGHQSWNQCIRWWSCRGLIWRYCAQWPQKIVFFGRMPIVEWHR